MTSDLDDAELVAQARGGSRDAVAALFARHWLDAWRAAFALTGRRAAADDVAQESFERAIARLASFNGSGSFAAWLHRIVVNRALNLARDERRLVALEEQGPAGTVAGPEEASVEPELMAALAALAPERRAVLVARFWLGYSLAEAADLLSLPLGTVQSRQARALAELRERLGVSDG
jgi:RNA polymerase sigma-70 factor (ECF subfamily)